MLLRFRANGYSLFARRFGEPLARLRLTGNGDEVVLLYPSHRAAAGRHPATSERAPCRSAKLSSASAPIHTSWNYGRLAVEPHQRINARGRRFPGNYSSGSGPDVIPAAPSNDRLLRGERQN